MKVGIALNMLTQEGRPDAAVLADHLALGDLAEPLGFDSLFALELHFTGYAMSPSPTQLLSYFAGRTKRVTLGTAVIVLPWHDPVRIAEEIALLDILSGGRSGRVWSHFGLGGATPPLGPRSCDPVSAFMNSTMFGTSSGLPTPAPNRMVPFRTSESSSPATAVTVP